MEEKQNLAKLALEADARKQTDKYNNLYNEFKFMLDVDNQEEEDDDDEMIVDAGQNENKEELIQKKKDKKKERIGILPERLLSDGTTE